MSTQKLSNLPLRKYRLFLTAVGLNLIKTSKGRGGHEKWSKQSIDRPITIQSHICPVPEFIVKQHLRHLKMTREQFFEVYDKIK